jgi:16S rRNA (guanine527-N7)-methyltransferase
VPVHARVESFTPEQSFDTVIARAFAPLPAMLASIHGITGGATRVLALKGRYPQQELAQLPPDWRVDGVRAVLVPGLAAQRHIVRLSLVS